MHVDTLKPTQISSLNYTEHVSCIHLKGYLHSDTFARLLRRFHTHELRLALLSLAEQNASHPAAESGNMHAFCGHREIREESEDAVDRVRL